MWNVDTNRKIFEVDCEVMDLSQIVDVAFSPNGKLLAGGGYGTGCVVWNVCSGKPYRWLPSPNGTVLSLAFLDDNTIAVGTDDGFVNIYNIERSALTRQLGHFKDHRVDCVAVSSDFVWLAWADGNVYLWRPGLSLEPRILEGLTNHFTNLSFSTDSRYLAAGTSMHFQQIAIWHLSTKEVVVTTEDKAGYVAETRFHPVKNSCLIWSSGDRVYFWDWERNEVLGSLDADALRLDVSSDGTRLATVSGSAATVWQVRGP